MTASAEHGRETKSRGGTFFGLPDGFPRLRDTFRKNQDILRKVQCVFIGATVRGGLGGVPQGTRCRRGSATSQGGRWWRSQSRGRERCAGLGPPEGGQRSGQRGLDED